MPDDDIDTLLAKLAATPKRRPPLHLLGTKRFELRRKLGSGAFGDVYEARDREHGTRVALKSLKSSNPDWIYRFKREFRIVGDLAHPNLVRLYELFLDDDRWYLTMEMIDGLRFDEHIRRAPDQLRSCFGQLALGVIELHRARCLHRDLKPSNALVETIGRVVLLDFGLAVHQRAGRTSAVAGTPPYIAPEVGLGQAPSEASDWYAFGVMLYEALAGELPFTGNEMEMLQSKLGEPPPAPSTLKPGVDPALERLALRLLAKQPTDRATATDILNELVGERLALAEVTRRRAPATPVVGRAHALATLDAALTASLAGPVVVAVNGPPGIGKTSLVDTFCERIRGDHAQIYQGRCLELESIPFKGVDGAIDLLCNDLRRRRYDEVERLAPRDMGALTQMFPMLKRVEAFSRVRPSEAPPRSPQETRRAGSRALRELVGNMGPPVVLFVDDMQWSGEDTVRLLLELVTSPPPAVLLIVAYRRELGGASPLLDSFLAELRERSVTPIEIDLAPLDEGAVGDWIASHPDARVSLEQAMRETAGHPYLMSRLLQHGSQGADGPTDLTVVLAGELEQLDADARALLELIAIAGGPIRPEAVFAAAGMPPDPATIDQLRRRKLVQSLTATADTQIEAYHDRVRETVLATLTGPRQRDLHGRLALVLESSELAEPETLARHYRRAGEVERALVWTRKAAEHATAALAFARAVELYLQASELALTPAQRLEVLEELANAQVEYGRRSDAAQTCVEAAALAHQLGRASVHATLRARAGEHFLLAGQLERGLELIRDALVAVDVVMPVSPAVAVAESFNFGGVLATRGLGFRRRPAAQVEARLLQRVDLELQVARSLTLTDIRAPLMATRALLDALEAGEPHRVQRALAYYVHASSARAPGDPIVVEADARAHELAAELDDELGAAAAELATGFHAIQRFEHLPALEALERAERQFLAAGPAHAREATMARLTLVMLCGNYCVDIHRAHARQAGCIDEAMARGDMFNATWAQFVDCMLALAGGDPARARLRLAQVRTTWPRAVDSLFAVGGIANEISVALYENPATAWATVVQLEPDFRQLFSSMMPFSREVWTRLAGNAAMAAWVAGRADRRTTTARLEPLLEEVSASEQRQSGRIILESHLRNLAGDRRGRIALLEEVDAGWARQHQHAFALLARLRIHQLHDDPAAVIAVDAELQRLGVAEPDRFAVLYTGPGDVLPPAR